MGATIGKLGGRAFVVALIGLVVVIVTATTNIEVSEDLKKTVIEAVMAIAGAHSVGRGIADGLSAGKTASAISTKDAG